ncbi:unnamed protein product, partial [Ectocarpus sp. 13 AM-2016]
GFGRGRSLPDFISAQMPSNSMRLAWIELEAVAKTRGEMLFVGHKSQTLIWCLDGEISSSLVGFYSTYPARRRKKAVFCAHPFKQKSVKELEAVQMKAAKIILGCSKR